jgi:predicted nucleic acid-binding protein
MSPERGGPVLLDSSVLFPNVLRDTLLTLAEHDLFEPQWSTEILAEVRRNVIAQRPVPQSAIDRTLALMAATFEHATVEGWEPLVDQLHLPDPDDRHVLAAAIAGGAFTIVTANLRHFPVATLRPHRVAPGSRTSSCKTCSAPTRIRCWPLSASKLAAKPSRSTRVRQARRRCLRLTLVPAVWQRRRRQPQSCKRRLGDTLNSPHRRYKGQSPAGPPPSVWRTVDTSGATIAFSM